MVRPYVRHGKANERRSRVLLAAVALVAACTTGRIGEPVPAAPTATDVETTLFLVGDAGDPHPGFEPVLAALTADLQSAHAPAIVAFLGDNIYPTGMPARNMPGRATAERRLGAQIDAVVAGGGTGLFLPGNHDWNYSGANGRIRLLAAEEFGTARGKGQVRFVPGGACPGPATIDMGAHTRLVVLDTEWWLRKVLPPAATLAGCIAITRAEVLDSLRFSIATAGERNVIVLGHHPLVTNGTHGGHFNLRQHLFPLTDVKPWAWLPLPVIGSAYPIARKLGISNQDLSGTRYEAMSAAFESVFTASPPLVYASGHEHTLQVLEGLGAKYQIVSGAGFFGHTSPVTRSDRTIFHAPGRSGYVRLDIQRDGRVRLGVVQVNGKGESERSHTRHIWSESGVKRSADVPFSNAAFLGDPTTVRLGVKQLYAGDAEAHANAELRLKLARAVLVLPADFGIFGLVDTGRVWFKNEPSDRWHRSAGGGIWLAFLQPENTFSLAVVSAEGRTGVYVGAGFAF